MSAAPMVSVIVVCFNAADVLGRCLDHLIAQDHRELEIIVVDDGSSDDSVAVAEAHLKHGNVSVIVSPVNRGCPHARNLGLGAARGDIIAFIDADGFAQPDWASQLVATFTSDPSIGGVASTVFFASNPMVVNGGGGTLNRRGWALDVGYNLSFDHFQAPKETLYPMGCGMAVRRDVIEAVGPFDGAMLNYYDDVDYGIRIWRAGFRVVVGQDAWIDHGWGQSAGDSMSKQQLCEQHRMRVQLTHASMSTLVRWLPGEWRATRRMHSPRYEMRRQAIRWNIVNLPSALRTRWQLRHASRPPPRLFDPSWGETFSVTAPERGAPDTRQAAAEVDMVDDDVDAVLPYGWYWRENDGTASYRWTARAATVLMAVEQPAAQLVIDFRFPHLSVGYAEIALHAVDPLRKTLPTVIRIPAEDEGWRRERHPVALARGTYEVRLTVPQTWVGRGDRRGLGLGVARLALTAHGDMPVDRLDVGSEADEHFAYGWYNAEGDGKDVHRWTGPAAVALVRLSRSASAVRMAYRFPSKPTGGVHVALRPVGGSVAVWSTVLPWRAGDIEVEHLDAEVGKGDYELVFTPADVWTDPPREQRRLGVAIGFVEFLHEPAA